MTSELPRISVRKREAGELLGVSTKHIDRLINAGELRASKSGAAILIEYGTLVEHFERGRI